MHLGELENAGDLAEESTCPGARLRTANRGRRSLLVHHLRDPGLRKTTLCTTIFRAIVEGGKPGLYVSWREFARRAKAVGNDRDDFREETEPLKNTPLLYLDDFWKGEIRPADVHLAFELINARYISKKPTILSSENTLEAILRGDEAIGSRLFEMAGGYYMDCSRARNWRTARRQT